VLKDQGRLEDHLAYVLTRILRWGSATLALSAVLAQWGVAIGFISGILAVSGGTIIGFAALNTLGNAIAGLIVMTSRPFRVGDRILFKNQFADVISVEIIYTKMITVDNVIISVPNQELLTTEIDNYGRNQLIRRSIPVTVDFQTDSDKVERVLIEATGRVEGIVDEPSLFVRITEFKDFAVEYTLYVFIRDVKQMMEIEGELRRAVFEECRRNTIDISTPPPQTSRIGPSAFPGLDWPPAGRTYPPPQRVQSFHGLRRNVFQLAEELSILGLRLTAVEAPYLTSERQIGSRLGGHDNLEGGFPRGLLLETAPSIRDQG